MVCPVDAQASENRTSQRVRCFVLWFWGSVRSGAGGLHLGGESPGMTRASCSAGVWLFALYL
jgi:hypothetical protein